MTTPITQFPQSAIAEIRRIDDLLSLNRDRLTDTKDPVKVRVAIDKLLDERFQWMQIRDRDAEL